MMADSPSTPDPDDDGLDAASTTHPHEPNVPAIIDGDGRCLVCAIDYAAGELAREVARRPAGTLRAVGWLDPAKDIPTNVVVSDAWLPVYVVTPAPGGSE